MSIRTQIIDKVVERLKTIRLGSSVNVSGDVYSYQSDLGLKVHLERQGSFTPDQLPAVNVWPGEVSTDEERSEIGRPLRVFEIAFDAIAQGKSSDEADRLVEDLLAAVGSDPRWSGLARWSEPSLGAVSSEEREKYFHGSPVIVSISYRALPFQY